MRHIVNGDTIAQNSDTIVALAHYRNEQQDSGYQPRGRSKCRRAVYYDDTVRIDS
jgi:hypothetical protein